MLSFGHCTCFLAMIRNITDACHLVISVSMLLIFKVWVGYTLVSQTFSSGWHMFVSAPRCFQRVCIFSNHWEERSEYCFYDSLSPGTLAWAVEDSSWQWISGSLDPWNCYWVLGWYQVTILPENIQLLCRLPRKVCVLFIGTLTFNLNCPLRILLASIRNLGQCPCPRCLIPLDLVHNLGMPRDMMQQVSKACVDSIECQNKVAVTRRFIYERNMQVNSTAVEALLRDWSGVPTTVSQPSSIDVL